MKKLVRTIMIASLFLTLAAGCIGAEDRNGEREKAEEEPFLEKAQIEIVVDRKQELFPAGMDPNEHPDVQFIEDQMGIDLKLSVLPGNRSLELLSAMLVSSQAPELIHSNDFISFSKYAKEGLLMPLDDHLRLYGKDLLQLLPQEAWDAVTYEGRIYAIPSLTEVPADEILYARKDWLDALGLAPPRTLEEYYQVMRAFTYDDPDRNGKNDTWGLTIMPTGLARTGPFFGAFGIPRSEDQINQWQLENGVLVYSSLLAEMKAALEFLAKLYGEGILDREFMLNREKVFSAKIVNGQIGLFSARWNDTQVILSDSKAKDPQAEWIRLDYPVGEDGQRGTARARLLQGYNIVPIGSANAEEAVRVLNYIAGQGHRELKVGNGQEQESVLAHDAGERNRSALYRLANSGDPSVRKEWLDSFGIEYELYDNVQYVMEHALQSDYTGPHTPSMGKYADKLLKLEEEAFIKMIIGVEPSNDFEDFSKKWFSEGGWEIRNEVNAWYRETGRSSE